MAAPSSPPPHRAAALLLLIALLACSGCAGLRAARDIADAKLHRHPDSTGAPVQIENRSIPGPESPIPVRIFRPEGSGPLPVLVYFHGGGWTYGSLSTHQDICRFLARNARCIVVSVAYRLAPRHRFPAAVEDAYAATHWAAANARLFGGDGTRIGVCGDSAGANLSAVVTLMARDRGGPQLAVQVLAYPPTDLTSMDTESYRTYADSSILSKAQVLRFRDRYLARPEDRANPYASPLRAVDLGGLPPALVITGEYDVLRDEGEAYARRLSEAGVPVKTLRTPRQGHAVVYWATASEKARKALDAAVSAIRAGFSE